MVIDALRNGEFTELVLVVHSLHSPGRDLLDILQTIEVFNEEGVPIYLRSEGLRTLNADGKPNPTAKMVISILEAVAEIERAQIRERQMEGIAVAKAKSKYVGRRPESVEGRKSFLAKPRTEDHRLPETGLQGSSYHGTKIG